MNINDLTVSFSHLNTETLFEDWEWLIGRNKHPVLITKAGDAFLQDNDTGEVHFLDITEGLLFQVASTGDEFTALLSDENFVMEHFSVNLIAPLLKEGDNIQAGMLYGWEKPCVLGGEFSSDNLEPTDIEVHFSMQGQIWNQVKDLPEGSSIGNVNVI